MDDGENVGGRPTLYREEYNEQARKLCILGATDAEVADFFGVTEQTVNNWKHAHPKFFESLKAGKIKADALVAHSLYNRAIGYKHDAVKILAVAVGNNGGSEIEEVPYVERYPPDTTAAIFWLKNRRPDQWRDKTQTEFSADESLAALIVAAGKGGTPDSP